jgi:lipopolysaccharide export system permease protein
VRFPWTLSGYVLREVVQYAVLGFVAVAALLVAQNLLRQLQDVAGLGVRAGELGEIALALGAMLSTYSVPIALLFGVLVASGRLSSDGEVLGMRALGVSLGQLMAPVMALALITATGTAWLLHEAEPAARRSLRAILTEVAARGGIIEEGTFNPLDRERSRLLFVDRREGDRLVGVMIFDHSNPARPFTVVASTGEFQFEEESARAHLRLQQGDIHFEPKRAAGERYQRVAFESFDYAFDLSALTSGDAAQLRPSEMTTAQLAEVLETFERRGHAPRFVRVKDRERYEVQYHRRMALPFAPLLLAAIGLPLGLRRSRGARSYGILICVALVFSYYMLLSAGTYFAESGTLPAAAALWIPNVVFAVAAVVVLARARRSEA